MERNPHRGGAHISCWNPAQQEDEDVQVSVAMGLVGLAEDQEGAWSLQED